jgi:hypothetical protein
MLADDDDFVSLKDDIPKQFKVRSLDEDEKERKEAERLASKITASQSTPRSATFGSVTIEELKAKMAKVEATKSPSQKVLQRKEEDLNGIQPLTPLAFSAVAAAMALVGWQLTIYMSGHFAVDFLDSEYYPIQRFAIVSRNIVVGITTLGTAFSGIISLGLVLLSARVTMGVAKGELDPNKKPLSKQSDNDKVF